jgi:hypothetical protein
MKQVFIAVVGVPNAQQLHNPRLKATYHNGFVVFEGLLSLIEFEIIALALRGIKAFVFWDVSQSIKDLTIKTCQKLAK